MAQTHLSSEPASSADQCERHRDQTAQQDLSVTIRTREKTHGNTCNNVQTFDPSLDSLKADSKRNECWV